MYSADTDWTSSQLSYILVGFYLYDFSHLLCSLTWSSRPCPADRAFSQTDYRSNTLPSFRQLLYYIRFLRNVKTFLPFPSPDFHKFLQSMSLLKATWFSFRELPIRFCVPPGENSLVIPAPCGGGNMKKNWDLGKNAAGAEHLLLFWIKTSILWFYSS